jgi:hypothetical protein
LKDLENEKYHLKEKIEELEKQITTPELAKINENFNLLRGARENADNMAQLFDDGNCFSNWKPDAMSLILIIADTNVFINNLNICNSVYNFLYKLRKEKKINYE